MHEDSCTEWNFPPNEETDVIFDTLQMSKQQHILYKRWIDQENESINSR